MNEPAEPLQDGGAAEAAPASARLLLRVVYSMGVVLVLLFLLLVGGIVWKLTRPAAPPVAERVPGLGLDLPAGTLVQSMVLDGDRLAINIGTEIIVIDIRKNRILTRLAVTAK